MSGVSAAAAAAASASTRSFPVASARGGGGLGGRTASKRTAKPKAKQPPTPPVRNSVLARETAQGDGDENDDGDDDGEVSSNGSSASSSHDYETDSAAGEPADGQGRQQPPSSSRPFLRGSSEKDASSSRKKVSLGKKLPHQPDLVHQKKQRIALPEPTASSSASSAFAKLKSVSSASGEGGGGSRGQHQNKSLANPASSRVAFADEEGPADSLGDVTVVSGCSSDSPFTATVDLSDLSLNSRPPSSSKPQEPSSSSSSASAGPRSGGKKSSRNRGSSAVANSEAGSMNQRPTSIPVEAGGSGKNSGNGTSGKKSRWLLCYPSGGTANSESPSPPSEAESNLSTPSPTDHGFKIPNSFSNERPTSLPVALLNSTNKGEFLAEKHTCMMQGRESSSN